jgi:hypothetical protein
VAAGAFWHRRCSMRESRGPPWAAVRRWFVGVEMVHPPVKAGPRLRSWQAMAVSMHRSLVEGVIIAVCFHYTRVASGGNTRSGYPGSDLGTQWLL